jgi:hypothetical protein
MNDMIPHHMTSQTPAVDNSPAIYANVKLCLWFTTEIDFVTQLVLPWLDVPPRAIFTIETIHSSTALLGWPCPFTHSVPSHPMSSTISPATRYVSCFRSTPLFQSFFLLILGTKIKPEKSSVLIQRLRV